MSVLDPKLIQDIHAAPLDPSKWQAILETLRLQVGASSGNLLISGTTPESTQVLASTEIDQAAVEDYHAYFHKFDIWLERSRRFKPGSILRGPRIIQEKAFLNSKWYNDFLRRLEIGHLASARLQGASLHADYLSLYRPWRMEDFDAATEHVLREVMPHLSSAIAVHRHLIGLERRLAATEDAFDRLPFGIALLDRNGRLVHANALAWQTLRERDGLDLVGEQLALPIAGDQRKLDRLIHAAVMTGKGDGRAPGGFLTVPRPSLKPALSIFVAPISDTDAARPGLFNPMRPDAIIVINNPEWKAKVPSAFLEQRYGLTPAEARLAAALANGASLQQAAEEFGVVKGTVRTQLKQIFAKTHTKRQSDLVRLLIADLAALAAGQAGSSEPSG